MKREEAEPQEEEREEFEAPTMSFESFLTYDAPTPTKKKKKLLKPPPKPAVVAPPPAPPSKPSTTNGARSSSKRSEPASAPITPKPEKRKKVRPRAPYPPAVSPEGYTDAGTARAEQCSFLPVSLRGQRQKRQ